MKVRTGFVSNSSSSSFCIIGWRIELTEEEEELLKDTVHDYHSTGDIGIVGYWLGGSDDFSLDSMEVDLKLVQSRLTQIAKALNLTDKPLVFNGMTYG